jgi:hypothetical protein
MLFPPQLGIKNHTKIFSCVGIWKFYAIDEDWLLFNLVACEVNMYRFGFNQVNKISSQIASVASYG